MVRDHETCNKLIVYVTKKIKELSVLPTTQNSNLPLVNNNNNGAIDSAIEVSPHGRNEDINEIRNTQQKETNDLSSLIVSSLQDNHGNEQSLVMSETHSKAIDESKLQTGLLLQSNDDIIQNDKLESMVKRARPPDTAPLRSMKQKRIQPGKSCGPGTKKNKAVSRMHKQQATRKENKSKNDACLM